MVITKPIMNTHSHAHILPVLSWVVVYFLVCCHDSGPPPVSAGFLPQCHQMKVSTTLSGICKLHQRHDCCRQTHDVWLRAVSCWSKWFRSLTIFQTFIFTKEFLLCGSEFLQMFHFFGMWAGLPNLLKSFFAGRFNTSPQSECWFQDVSLLTSHQSDRWKPTGSESQCNVRISLQLQRKSVAWRSS